MYQIELPPRMKRAHNVFHVYKLKGYVLGQSTNIEVVSNADGHIEQEVKMILYRRNENGKASYVTRFVGDEPDDAVWLEQSHLGNCKELGKRYDEV